MGLYITQFPNMPIVRCHIEIKKHTHSFFKCTVCCFQVECDLTILAWLFYVIFIKFSGSEICKFETKVFARL